MSEDLTALGKYLGEVSRLLRVGGYFAVCTAWTPERRAERLGACGLHVYLCALQRRTTTVSVRF
jgi:hypothetical protein